MQQESRARTAFIVATYVALSLPVAVFLIAWCAAWVSIPAVLTLLWGGRSFLSLTRSATALDRWAVLFAVVLGTVGFSISGAGGVGPQGFDQIKHNSVLADLISHSWPVFFSTDEPLVYYLAYYLLPALAGKVGGWGVANVTLALQTWILYVLAALWVVTLANRHPKATLLLFVFFSGLDPLGNWIVRGAWGYHPWWARLQFSDPAILIISVPQHVAIGWIGAAVVFAAARTGQAQAAVIVWALSAYWSPFVTLGLTPFVLYVWLRHRGFRRSVVVQVSMALFVLLPAVLFFRSGSTILDTYKWSTMGVEPRTFAWFVLLEWGIYALLLAFVEGRRLLARPFSILAVASLAVIPLVSFPGYTDYVARVSIPALFFLALQVAESALLGLRQGNVRAVALWIALLIGALQPLAIYRQAFRTAQLSVPDRASVVSLPQLSTVTGSANDGLQYIGRADTSFFRSLASSRVPHE